ncbi:hypothetical protein BKM20_08190 [Pseudomonas avellanae]|nr:MULTISPECIES: hypothetical protein [Pseudomonas syringae group]AVB23238.1 hypothetical protein BKM03_24400 [Pseudomonas avellanae]KWS61852.1 hypothetical protein AL055_27600 [Pseudomonas amygdali pv. morsprunorum]PHN36124.1 hypothetical protein AO261_01295 [Pseudomonas avellanae]POC94997.1 hypothetical protein BKM26_08440 [Pseudomonas avellanae]POD10012.1 hypothetical protein BKM20_08190 [Pseudomonas avellanae]
MLNRAFTSILSNSQQIIGYPGAYWICTMTFGVLFDEDERQLTSLIGKLQGMYGTVNIPAITRTRVDDIGDAVVVSGFSQATFMTIGGVIPSAKVFSMGDYITVGGEMFEVIEDASSTAEGRVQVSLNKRIRKTLTVGAHVEYRNPYSEMRRLDDTHQVVQDPLVSNSALQFREAF